MAITPVTPDYTAGSGTAYPLNIDQGLASAQILANQFQPHESASGSPLAPDMTITIDAGVLYVGSVLTAKAQQITSASPADFIAPVTNPRIDRVGINITTGNYEVTTGTEAASPVAPDYPADNYPLCQIALATSTTQITNSLITDERVLVNSAAPSGTFVYSSSSQSIGNATVTEVQFGAEQYDDENNHDTVTNNQRIYVPNNARRARFTAQVEFQTNTTGFRYILISKNGGTTAPFPVSSTNATTTATYGTYVQVDSGVINVTPGDYYSIKAFQNSGGALNILNTPTGTWFCMETIKYV